MLVKYDIVKMTQDHPNNNGGGDNDQSFEYQCNMFSLYALYLVSCYINNFVDKIYKKRQQNKNSVFGYWDSVFQNNKWSIQCP